MRPRAGRTYVSSMYEKTVRGGRPLLWRARKGMLIMLLPAVAMGAAGFFVPPGSRTDDGFPLNCFFWGMAAFWALTEAVMLAIFSSSISCRTASQARPGSSGAPGP